MWCGDGDGILCAAELQTELHTLESCGANCLSDASSNDLCVTGRVSWIWQVADIRKRLGHSHIG